jgi:hypothetical protein
MCMDQKRLEINIQCIIEHKVDTGKYHVRQAFHASTRKVFDHATVELGSSEYSSVTGYKPGGTAIIVQGDVTGMYPPSQERQIRLLVVSQHPRRQMHLDPLYHGISGV